MMYGNMNIHLQWATHGVMLMMNPKALSIISSPTKHLIM